MIVAVVDDEEIALRDMEERLRELPEILEVKSFLSPKQALIWFYEHTVDIAFLDISMREMDGLSLAIKLKEIHPLCAVIFVTGHAEYAINAYEMHACGYLIKPAALETIRREVEHILYPPQLSAQSKKSIAIQCFGNFEVFVHGEPVKFRYSKTKELLAYLVDRHGAMVDMGQLCAILWEDKPDSLSLRSQLRNSISDLSCCMKILGIKKLLRKQKNKIAVNIDMIDCDYFRFFRMEPGAINTYRGEYMAQYSWAEMTVGRLEQLNKKE